MTIFHTIILGIVEGLTEFLPISSTAHMDIARTLLGIPVDDFVKSFEIVIQLGAILAVIVLYARRVFSSWTYVKNTIIAFVPTAVIGFVLYKIIKTYFLGNVWVEAWALLVGGIVILFFEWLQSRKRNPSVRESRVEDMRTSTLISLGVAQAVAVVPGVSRSGAVIIAGRSLNLSAVLITEFSFVLAVPTMLAASGYDILKSGIHFSGTQWLTILIGFFTAFLVALAVIRWLLSYVRRHSFKVFAWYRIVLGIVLICALYFKVL